MSEISMRDQVAIVTGAARGLGRSYALELSRLGADVVVNDIPGSESAAKVVARIEHEGGRAHAALHDVGTREGGLAIVDEAIAKYGRVDIVVNNAGFLRNAFFEDLDDAKLSDIFNVHLKGVFHVTEPAFTAMKENGYGRVVNVSSNTAFGMAGLINYATAKAGIIGLTKSLALEGAPHGILVNCVLPNAATKIMIDDPIPGFEEDTRFTNAFQGVSDRFDPELVAPLVAFLASRDCEVTGEALSSLGGRYARVFYGVSEGWMSPPASPVSADDIAGHIDEIMDSAEFFIPAQIRDEFEQVAARLSRTA